MFILGRNKNARKNKTYFEWCCGNDASEFLCKSTIFQEQEERKEQYKHKAKEKYSEQER